MKDDLPFGGWRTSESPEGHLFIRREPKTLPGQLSEMVNIAGHPNIPKHWAVARGSDGWATSELFVQDTAPCLAQTAECCPKELSGVSLSSYSHLTLPLVWTSSGERKACDSTSQPWEPWGDTAQEVVTSRTAEHSPLPSCYFIVSPHLPFPSC